MSDAPPPWEPPPLAPPPTPSRYEDPRTLGDGTSLAIAAFVISFAGLCLFPPLLVVALALGILARCRRKSEVAKAGIAVAVFGILAWSALLWFWFLGSIVR